MSYQDIARQDIENDEGLRLRLYKCTAGKTSIGYGRNLDDVGISQDEAEYLLANDLKRAEADARRLVSVFDSLTDNRKAALINMALNLGATRLAGFKQMLAAVNRRDWNTAATEMLDSDWANQVGKRADRLADKMRKG